MHAEALRGSETFAEIVPLPFPLISVVQDESEERRRSSEDASAPFDVEVVRGPGEAQARPQRQPAAGTTAAPAPAAAVEAAGGVSSPKVSQEAV